MPGAGRCLTDDELRHEDELYDAWKDREVDRDAERVRGLREEGRQGEDREAFQEDPYGRVLQGREELQGRGQEDQEKKVR